MIYALFCTWILSGNKEINWLSKISNENITYIFASTKEIITTSFTTPLQSNRRIYHSYTKYNYLLDANKMCSINDANSGPFLIVLVKSSVLHIEHRKAIRETWGRFNESTISIAFLLGYSQEKKQVINMESKKHKDIIQQNFKDDYYNNTLKTIMAFDWVIKRCPTAKFVFLVDDDYFVNLPNVVEYLRFHEKNKTNKVFAGSAIINAGPYRNRKSKWFISKEDYPYDKYPPFFRGGSIMLNMAVVKLLKNEIPYIKPIYLDDVFLGLVAHSLGIQLSNEQRFSGHIPRTNRHLYFSFHGLPPHKLLDEWVRVTCSYRHGKIFLSLYGKQKC